MNKVLWTKNIFYEGGVYLSFTPLTSATCQELNPIIQMGEKRKKETNYTNTPVHKFLVNVALTIQQSPSPLEIFTSPLQYLTHASPFAYLNCKSKTREKN